MAASQRRAVFLFLGIAIAVSCVFAVPHEQRAYVFEPVTTDYWVVRSCGTVVSRLLAGTFAQAILVPVFLFLLPGPGSILSTRTWQFSGFRLALVGQNAGGKHRAWPFTLIGLGWLLAAAVSIVWWIGLRTYTHDHWQCTVLFDLSPNAARVGYVSEYSRYFIYLSLFSGFWSGIAAGALRMQSARSAVADTPSAETRRFQAFFWVCFLGWAVQYRITRFLSPIPKSGYPGCLSILPS